MEALKIESTAGTREGVRLLRLTGPFVLQGVFEFQSVTRAVRTFDDRLELPTVATVADALNQFADAMLERRRLLPLLTKSA